MPKRGRYSRGPTGLSRMVDRRVMRFVAPEKKFFDVAFASRYAVDNTAGVIGPVLNTALDGTTGGITQGAGAQQRIGSKIALESLSMKLVLQTPVFVLPSSDPVPYTPQCRVMLVHDKQANGDVAAISDILVASAGESGNYLTYVRNLSNSARFSVLYDKTFTLKREFEIENSEAAGNVTSAEKVITINKKFKKPIIVEYATGSTTGDAESVMKHQFLLLLLPTNQDFLGAWTTPVAISARKLIMHGGCRARFTDV